MGSIKTNLSSNDFHTIVLSAGLGTRFRPHTNLLAKPAIPFLNIPFLYYATHLAEYLGTARIAINTFHLPMTVKELIIKIPPARHASIRNAKYVTCEEKPAVLGSSGGMLNLRSELDGHGDFLALNADTVFLIRDFSFFKIMQRQHQAQNALATIMLIEHPEVGKLYNGVWVDEKNNVVGIGKTSPDPGRKLRGLHYTGMLWLSDRVFNLIPNGVSDIFRDVLLPQIAKGEKVIGYEVQGLWFEGGSLDGYLKETQRALTLLSEVNLKDLPQFNGNNFLYTVFERFWPHFSHRKDLISKRSNAFILEGDNCQIHPTAQLNGFNVIGNNVQIKENVKLENSVVKEGKVLASGFSAANQLLL